MHSKDRSTKYYPILCVLTKIYPNKNNIKTFNCDFYYKFA